MEFFINEEVPGYYLIKRNGVGSLYDGPRKVTAIRNHEVNDVTVPQMEQLLGGVVVGFGPLADAARKYPVPTPDEGDDGVRRRWTDRGRRHFALHRAFREQADRRMLRDDRADGRGLH